MQHSGAHLIVVIQSRAWGTYTLLDGAGDALPSQEQQPSAVGRLAAQLKDANHRPQHHPQDCLPTAH